jgi:hypothetical protein
MISITGSNFSFHVNNNNKMTVKISSQDGLKFSNFFQEAKRQAGSENSKPSISNNTPSQEASTNTSRPRTGNDVRLPRNGEIKTVETDLSRKLEKLEAQGVDVGEIIRTGGTLPEPKPDPQVPTEPTLTEPQVAFDIALPIPLDADGNPQTVSLGNPETDTLIPTLPEEAFDIALPIPLDADGNPQTVSLGNPETDTLIPTLPEEAFDIALPIPLDANGNPQTVSLNKPTVTPIALGPQQQAPHKPEVQAEATRRNIFNFVVS